MWEIILATIISLSAGVREPRQVATAPFDYELSYKIENQYKGLDISFKHDYEREDGDYFNDISGELNYVSDEISKVKIACGNAKLKVILETGELSTLDNVRKASDLVNGDRQKDYGDKLHNHINIADLWTAYLDTTVSPHDVAVMMCLLKIARLKQGSRTEDTYLDASAYMAIAREIQERLDGEDNKEHRD